MRSCRLVLVLATVCCALVSVADGFTKADAEAALKKAVTFLREEVSAEGGYLWRYSADLSRREGEGKADASMAWVQPPGTPSMGQAFLTAYECTQDAYYLEAAVETARALVKGQLASGGWDYRIEFNPERRTRYAYRVAPSNPEGHNTSTLDDNTTQAALRFLMRVDKALDFKDEAIHEATLYGIEALLAAQYPIGAWPQRFTGPPDPDKYPVKKASYPESWPRTFPNKDYRGYYTFNDNTIADAIQVMFDAFDLYGDERCTRAADKAGDFILLAQMPDPQPGWAQQYDPDMHPAWARKFEPPAVTGGESQGVMRTLLFLYTKTGDKKYLEPLPRALEYYKKSLLPDGRLARFYELETNRPLYFTKTYELTYSSDDMPTHYAFITTSRLDDIEAQYNTLVAAGAPPEKAATETTYKMTDKLAAFAQTVADGLDERGAWVEDGSLRYHGDDDPTRRIIDARNVAGNIVALSEFIAASKAAE